VEVGDQSGCGGAVGRLKSLGSQALWVLESVAGGTM
jgi:hypothetical protein